MTFKIGKIYIILFVLFTIIWAQQTTAIPLSGQIYTDADSSLSGEMCLFNPSSTTFVKHFLSRSICNGNANYAQEIYAAGYCNTTTAIDGVQFAMSSGNIDAGSIKLYGIKDS